MTTIRQSISAPLLSALFALLLSACSTGPQIRTSYDPHADFTHYRTYAYYSPLDTDTQSYESLISRYMKQSSDRQMQQRGYIRDEQTPDLLINFHALRQPQTQVSYLPAPAFYPYGWYGGYGWRGGWSLGWYGFGPWPGYQTIVDQYVENVLTIDLIDTRRQQLVWQGTATNRIDDDISQDSGGGDDGTKINAAVDKIFARYPFRAPLTLK